jgi:hypothetical protein
MLWQTTTLKTTDLDGLAGKHWMGTLTYLDYGTNQLTPIPTELFVKIKSPGVYQWMTSYPKETDHNSNDELVISPDGKLLDGETVKERIASNGILKIITETTGKDNNKPAHYRLTYLIGKDSFSRKKEVCYDGQSNWFIRNELKLATK